MNTQIASLLSYMQCTKNINRFINILVLQMFEKQIKQFYKLAPSGVQQNEEPESTPSVSYLKAQHVKFSSI